MKGMNGRQSGSSASTRRYRRLSALVGHLNSPADFPVYGASASTTSSDVGSVFSNDFGASIRSSAWTYASGSDSRRTALLRVRDEFLARQYHQWIVPVPTWGNHFKVFTFASLSVKTYQCYDPATHGSDFKGLVQIERPGTLANLST